MAIEKTISEPAMRLLEKKGEAHIIKVPLQIDSMHELTIAKHKGQYYIYTPKCDKFVYYPDQQNNARVKYKKTIQKYEVE